MDNPSLTVAGSQARTPRSIERPNYNVLHSQPLPLRIDPLPPFIPHNPLSILYIAFIYFRQAVFPTSSHLKTPYGSYFSSETRSIHVTNPIAIRALWEHGFFGKGSLSRSEPTWLDREKRRLGLIVGETSEEITRRRREERKAFKQDRARKLREEIEQKKKAELGALGTSVSEKDSKLIKDLEQAPADAPSSTAEISSIPDPENGLILETQLQSQPPDSNVSQVSEHGLSHNADQLSLVKESEIANMEHLQLDFNEAFFLAYALGVLNIFSEHTNAPMSHLDLLLLFVRHASFPPLPSLSSPAEVHPDNKFLLHYVTYHHFRSLGWVVRPGIKFGVDLLLYNRGPVFTHAEFAVAVMPSYNHYYWKKGEGRQYLERVNRKEWHWLHMVSRVQSQVKKTLVLCFVEVPPPWGANHVANSQIDDVGNILKKYTVREIVLRRWVPNRTRD